MTSAFARLLPGWLDLPRSVRLLITAMFTWEIGLGLYDALLPVHLGRLGAQPEQIGLVFSLAYFVVAVFSPLAGWLADRFERRRTMLFFWMVGTPSVLLIGLAGEWRATLPGVALYYLSFMAFPAINAYLTDHCTPRQLTLAFAWMYATYPASALIGPGVGGWLAERFGLPLVFISASGFYLLSTLVVTRLSAQAPHPLEHPVAPWQVWRQFPRQPRFWQVAGLGALSYLVFTLLQRFVSPYLVEVRGYDLFQVGLLASVTALGGVLLTSLSGRLAGESRRAGVLAANLGLFGGSLLVIGAGLPGGLLVGAFLLQGCFIAGRAMLDALVGSLSKGAQAGMAFGAFGLLTGLGQMIAPALGGWLYAADAGRAFAIAGAATLLAGGVVWWGLRER